MKRWYAVHTHAKAEATAATHLARQGFDVFVPLCRRRRSHARKIEWVSAPLFPRYVFVAMDLDAERWRAVHSTVGVRHLVCLGEDPAVVPDDVIDALRTLEGGDGLIDFRTRLRPGDSVVVTAGPMMDRIGRLEGLDDKDRVVVLLDLLGRETRVRLAGSQVQPAA
jgi:transcriptional antiterminator RfaH